MADFSGVPVNFSSEQLEERINKPIDTRAQKNSSNFITSGAVYDVGATKLTVFQTEARTITHLSELVNTNFSVDNTETILFVTITRASEISNFVDAGNYIGLTDKSSGILTLINRKNFKIWIYNDNTKSVDKKVVESDDILGGAITPFLLDRTYLEYDGKYTVSTFAELEDVLNEKQYLNVLYAFTFPENSEIHNVVKGVNFIATHGAFIDTDSGKIWVYANRTLTPKSTITKNAVVSAKSDLNSLFDQSIDFVNVEIVGGFGTIPNGQFFANKISYKNGLNGYLLTSLKDGSRYFYNRDTEEFKTYSSSGVVVDQTYNPESENAQSGIAVAEAIEAIVGDIDIALDNIITIQNSYIGGATE